MNKKVSKYIDEQVKLIMLEEAKENLWNEIQKPFAKIVAKIDKTIRKIKNT